MGHLCSIDQPLVDKLAALVPIGNGSRFAEVSAVFEDDPEVRLSLHDELLENQLIHFLQQDITVSVGSISTASDTQSEHQ